MDVLERLTRKDKWALGGGRGAVCAPPFPKWLQTPGFWDECFLADLRFPRLFTILFMRDGRPVRTHGRILDWNPARLRVLHEGDGLTIEEERCVTASNAFVSRLTLVQGPPVDAFLWSLLDLRDGVWGAPFTTVGAADLTDEATVVRWDTAWPAEVAPDRTGVEAENVDGGAAMLPPVSAWLAFGADAPRRSHTVNLAQRHDDSPLYELSVLPQKLRNGRLLGDFKLRVGVPPIEGLLHLVGQYRVEARVTFACGTGLSREAAFDSLQEARSEDAILLSETSWRDHFRSVPRFDCEDPFLTNAYWNRWFGLRLNTVDLKDYRFQGHAEDAGPFVTEGIGFFRNFVSYSAQAHLRELAWMKDPRLAIGILDNLAEVQCVDGSFPGHSYSARPSRDFYHADFGTPLAQLFALHPEAIDRRHLAALRRYADYLVRYRTRSKDPSRASLYDVFDQNETGQEYMSRYPDDAWGHFRIAGVDATVYAERTFSALAGFRFVQSPYGAFADGARRGLQEWAWNREAAFFCDVTAEGRSGARPAIGLYPLLVPGLEEVSRQAIERWLGNEEEFWLPAGFPATARSDPSFSAEGEWRGRRTNCPWNGRSWPMANAHLVDGLARVARVTGDPALRRRSFDALMKCVRLMFHDGDPDRPNSYEHYDPFTGRPSLYRGYDDYMHSWVVDLILRHVCGIQPGTQKRDPLSPELRYECDIDLDWERGP